MYLLPNGCKDVSSILHGPDMLLARWLHLSVCPPATRPALHPLFLPGPVHELARAPIPFLPIGNHVPPPTTPIPAHQYRQLRRVVR